MTFAPRKCRLLFLILAVIVAFILVSEVTFSHLSIKVHTLSSNIQAFRSSIHIDRLPGDLQVFKSSSIVDSNRRDLGGFITAMRYSGQQGAGIRAIKSLQCWASRISMPMSILEPAIKELAADFPPATASPIPQSTTHIKLSDLFDIEQFNKEAKDRHLPQLMPRRQFIKNAPKNIILVWVVQEDTSKEADSEVIWPEYTNVYGKCLDIQTADRQWQEYAKPFSVGDYCIVKVVKANYIKKRAEIFAPEDAKPIIYGHWSPEEVTLIFTLWKGNYRPVLGSHITRTDKDCFSTSSGEYFIPNQRLLNHAQMYEQQYLKGKNTLAIMFRLERMIQFLDKSHNKSLSVAKCLEKVIKINKEIQGEHASYLGTPFVTIDIGEFGSNNWVNASNHFKQNVTYLQRKAEETISTISQTKWNIKNWEETFKHIPGVVNNPAYIAALQRVLASRADCLVLVGGGHFQSIALKDYQVNHPNKINQCFKSVCIMKSKTDLSPIHHF